MFLHGLAEAVFNIKKKSTPTVVRCCVELISREVFLWFKE